MIRAGFLSREDRADLIALARDGSAAHRLGRRANALLLLDDGSSCEEAAKVLFLDDDTVRRWHGLFLEDGLEGLTRFEVGGRDGFLCVAQETALKAFRPGQCGSGSPASISHSVKRSEYPEIRPLRATRRQCMEIGDLFDDSKPRNVADFPYEYRLDLQGGKGQTCKVLVRGTKNSRLLEFEDDYWMVTSGNALKTRR